MLAGSACGLFASTLTDQRRQPQVFAPVFHILESAVPAHTPSGPLRSPPTGAATLDRSLRCLDVLEDVLEKKGEPRL